MFAGTGQDKKLGDEFDIDQTAGHQLQVEPARGLPLVIHQLAHGGNFARSFDRIARPGNDSRDGAHQGGIQFRIAGNRTGTRQRHVFPRLGFGLLIGFK